MKNNKKGFSLAEVMIVVAIMVILTGAGTIIGFSAATAAHAVAPAAQTANKVFCMVFIKKIISQIAPTATNNYTPNDSRPPPIHY